MAARDDVNIKPKHQFRWTDAMEVVLINFLVDEVKAGRKLDKSFKKTSIVQAAKAISLEFNTCCNSDHVENRMRTIKKKFGEVRKIQMNGSGFGWVESQKMFTCSLEIQKIYCEAHPKASPYLNKPIEMYDEFTLTCGDAQATGSFAKSNTDELNTLDEGINNIESNDELDVEEITSTQIFSQNPEIPISQPRSHGKRKRVGEEVTDKLDKIADSVANVAAALITNTNQEHVRILYNEVTKMEGFDESDLEDAFDYLNKNEIEAIGFIVKKDAGKKKWLTKFLSEK